MKTKTRAINIRSRGGFSLIELVAIIGIMAILITVLAPSLLSYTERSRAGKDVSTMDEITNAFLVGITKKEAYDEVVQDSMKDNISCYIDQPTELGYERLVIRSSNVSGAAAQYTFNSDSRTADETVYTAAGNMRGMTVTFEPKTENGSLKSYYEIEDGIINKYTSPAQKRLRDDPNLCKEVIRVLGEKVQIGSRTYQNSEFTVFIRVGTTGGRGGSNQDAVVAYGQFSGTNLTPEDPDPVLATDRIVGDNTDYDQDTDGGGTTGDGTPSFDDADLSGSGDFFGGDDITTLGDAYAIYSEADGSLTFVRSNEPIEEGDIYAGKVVTKVYTGFETARYTIDWDTWETTCPWDPLWEDIYSVAFMDEIRPQSTAYWFFYMENCRSMNLGMLNTKYVTDMSGMFAYCSSLTSLNVSHFDTSKVFNMSGMFCGLYNLGSLNVSNFDTSNVTDMNNMFYGCDSLTSLDLSSFNTAKVQQTYWMFGDCSHLKTIYASSSNWTMDSVTVSNDMFNGTTSVVGGCGTEFDWYFIDKTYALIDEGESAPGYLTEKYVQDANVDLSNQAYAIFSYDDNSLTFIRADSEPIVGELYNGVTIDGVYSGFETDVYDFMKAPWYVDGVNNSIYTVRFDDVIKPISTAYWFAGLQNCEYIDVTRLDTSSTTSMLAMFCCAGNRADTFVVTGLGTLDTSKVINMSDMFSFGAENASTVNLIGIEEWDTQSVTNMSGMFRNFACGLDGGEFYLDLSRWDTSGVTTFADMFSSTAQGCNTFELNLNGWDTSSAKTMSKMFAYAGSQAKNWSVDGLSHFDTSNVTDMEKMFGSAASNATKITLDLSSWDVSKVSNAVSMFNGFGYSSNNVNLNLSGWQFDSLQYAGKMFYRTGRSATSGSLGDISAWGMANVVDMQQMFYQCKFLTSLDLSNWDTFKVTNMSSMFSGCTNLKTIYVSEWWNVDGVVQDSLMFYQCSSIVGQSGTTYNSSKIKKTMANYTTGYLTYKSGKPAQTVDVNIVNQCQDLITISHSDELIGGKTKVTLVPIGDEKYIKSFEINGQLINGNVFVVPIEGGTITISNVVVEDCIVVESTHNPYPNNADQTYEQVFDGATYITVQVKCETASAWYDKLYVYTSTGYQGSYGGYAGTTSYDWTIDGNYIKLRFKTDSSSNNYYGFRAVITPHYN